MAELCAVVGMAERFAAPVSDCVETQLRGKKTKQSTEWCIRLWNEWASSRISSAEGEGCASVQLRPGFNKLAQRPVQAL